jgi:hypothetical protein
METHKIVANEAWLAARKEVLAKEKACPSVPVHQHLHALCLQRRRQCQSVSARRSLDGRDFAGPTKRRPHVSYGVPTRIARDRSEPNRSANESRARLQAITRTASATHLHSQNLFELLPSASASYSKTTAVLLSRCNFSD